MSCISARGAALIINLEAGWVVLPWGETVQIVRHIDGTGADCELNKAVVIVAGPDMFGKWHAVNLAGFQKVRMH